MHKTQLQRFLGCLNYVSNFYQDCAKDRNLLNQRLRKNPSPWTSAHRNVVKNIKAKLKYIPILYVVDDSSSKIVESDASDLGWGGVPKQNNDGEE